MNEEEYLQTQNQIMLVAGLVAELPLCEFIVAAEEADVVGPLVDPTLWIKAKDNLGTLLDITRALRNFQDLVLTKRKLGTLQ